MVVLDFGIIESIARSHASGEVVGTAAYLAPEVAAGQAAAHASDWYAVGVMLFEAITGTRPFAGDSKTVLATKCGLPAPPCRKLAPKVPDDLADLCDGLLAIEPEDRPDVAGIRQGLTHSAAAAPARPRSVFAPRFVGRRAERSRLDTALEAVKASGRSRCVRVHGVSGMVNGQLQNTFHRISHRIDGDGSEGPEIDGADILHHEIDRIFARTFRHLLDRLSLYSGPRGGTLLDDSMALWTNDLANGPPHSYGNIPQVIAGSAGGFLRTGQYVDAGNVTHNRFLNTLINAAGIRNDDGSYFDSFGDASLERGVIPGMIA